MKEEIKKLDYQDLLDVPFKKDGDSIEEGFNCWNLCKEIYKRIGKQLPNYDQFIEQVIVDDKLLYPEINAIVKEKSKEFTRLVRPVPFCLVTIMTMPPDVTHIGVVLENKIKFIHIMEKTKVAVERLDSLLWANKIDGFWKWKN